MPKAIDPYSSRVGLPLALRVVVVTRVLHFHRFSLVDSQYRYDNSKGFFGLAGVRARRPSNALSVITTLRSTLPTLGLDPLASSRGAPGPR